MKILIYNWAAFDGGQGGGISVYLRRLIPELINNGCEVNFLSRSPSKNRSRVRIDTSENVFASIGVKSFVLESAEVPFPYRTAFGESRVFDSSETEEVFYDFVKGLANLKAIHFHSLEGLPPSLLRVGDKIPGLNVIFTAHNYHLVCQQLQLFRLQTMSPCTDYLNGASCVECLSGSSSSVPLKEVILERYPVFGKWIVSLVRLFARIKVLFDKPETIVSNEMDEKIHDSRVWVSDATSLQRANSFKHWREYNLESINQGKVRLTTVSRGAKSILSRYGIEADAIEIIPPAVTMISKVQNYDYSSTEKEADTNALNISFWGYSTPSKGLHLFIEALTSTLSNYEDAMSVEVTIVSDIGTRFKKELDLLDSVCKQVTIVEKYDAESFERISANVDLAVVCSVWHETYSQIAAELFFASVPILVSSSLGFATQHIVDPKFIFEADQLTDLCSKLDFLIRNPSYRKEYWATTSVPPLLSDNTKDLLSLYRTESSASSI